MVVLYYLLNLVSLALYVFDLALLARAICSWIPSSRNSMIYRTCYTVTEPILSPVRNLLFRLEWVRRCRIDLSFIVVIVLVNILSSTTTVLMSNLARNLL